MSVWAKKWAYEQHPKRVDAGGNTTDKKHPAAKSVLVALAEYPGVGQRICWPSQKTLAVMTDFTDRQVRACLSDLEAQGLIKRTRRHRKDGTRRSDMIELLGPTKEFGPPQDADSQPEESSASQPEESSGHEPSVEEPYVEANASSEMPKTALSQSVGLEKYIVDGLYAAMLENETPLDADEFGFHLGRAKTMLEKMNPTDEEIEALPKAFVDTWTIKGRADAKMALMELRRQKARTSLINESKREAQGPAPWEPMNPHSPRPSNLSEDELEKRRREREEMGRKMAEARQRDLETTS